MENKSFEIWWSPVGHIKGKKVITAPDKKAATKVAFEEMRKRSDCGAWGADEVKTSD